MNAINKVIGILLVLGFAFVLLLVYHYRADKYQIVYASYIATTNQDVLQQSGTVCYSNKELKDALKTTRLLDQAGMASFNLDEPDLIACVIPNYTVERIVGRQNLGLIIVRQNATNGISLTVFRGKKRMLQFNYQDAH